MSEDPFFTMPLQKGQQRYDAIHYKKSQRGENFSCWRRQSTNIDLAQY